MVIDDHDETVGAVAASAATATRRTSPDIGHAYRCYGMTLVADHELPGLMAAHGQSDDGAFRVSLSGIPDSLRERIDWSTSPCDDVSAPLRRSSTTTSLSAFEFADAFRFVVDTATRRIYGERLPTRTIDEALVFLAGPVLGYLLRSLSIVALHASAVALNDRALVLVGPSGAGKSTLAAALSLAGLRVMSDDIVALDLTAKTPLACSGYPALRLRPEAVDFLYGDRDHLPRFVPGWERRRLSLAAPGSHFQSTPLPVGWIFLLHPQATDVEPSVDRPGTAQALAMLSANSYGSAWLDRPMRREELAQIARLVACTPVGRVTYSHAKADIPGTVERVFEACSAGIDVRH